MAKVTVTMQDMAYSPSPVQIKAGDTIVWSNQDDSDHTASANDGSFDTGVVPSGASSAPIAFNRAGNIPYHCKIHGKRMSGTVQVV